MTWGKIKFIGFDFDGVMTDNAVYVDGSGRETVRCSRGDGMGIELLQKTGIIAYVISKEKNAVVAARCRKLRIKCVSGTDDKLPELKKILKKHRIDLKDAAFVGNDVNDSECLKAVGWPIVVKDAHPDVLALAKYITKAAGGHGAVREICDLIIKAKGLK
jgi:3-deoxy-D-manno-octulosonate 8-phosphate phosphatase (KDO 8-P phosphatase)